MEETKLSLVDYLNILKRRRLLMLVTFVIIMIIALLVTFGLPATYRSNALIMIEGQDIPEDLVRSTVTSFADERVQRITQRAMTSVNLSRIIDDHDLYPDEIDRVPRSEIIEDMREDITIDLVSADVIDPRSGRPTKATIAFSIAFDYSQPQAAQKVANDLVTLYRSVNLTQSVDQVEGAADFLEDLNAAHAEQVSALEEKLTELKVKNGGALPELMASNMTIMQRIERDSASTEASLQALKNRLIFLEAQLAQTEPDTMSSGSGGVTNPAEALAILESELRIAESQYASDHPDVRRYKRMIAEMRSQSGLTGGPSVDQIDEQIAAAEVELDVARGKYGELHPEVSRLNRLMTTLRNERVQAVEFLLGGKVTTAPSVANSINVREGPGTDTTIIGTLQKGVEAAIVDSSNSEWFKVILDDGTQGFVNRAYAVQTQTANATAQEAQPQGDAPTNPAYITLLANYQQAQSEAESLLTLYRKQQEKLAEYQAVLDRTPLVEREYSMLMRDLEAARMRLADSGAKAEEARVGVLVVEQTRAQSFNLLEPPIAPTQPHWPNRWVLLFLGFAMSLFGTLAAAALAESVDDSVRSAKDINAIIGGPPIALIPLIATETDSSSSRNRVFIAIGLVFAAIAIFAIAIHNLFKPLDVLWFAIMRKIGI
ncbi:MAG: SH3 domain-containing protein [Gammaproteobacteria bacterium]